MTIHELKTWPEHFSAVNDGSKAFELRQDDRWFEVGDILHLREWSPDSGDYTGRQCSRRVTYLLRGGQFGLTEGHVAMSLAHDYSGEIQHCCHYPVGHSGDCQPPF